MLSLYVSYKDPLRFWMVLKNELDVTQFGMEWNACQTK